jgi:predicted acyl esterase
MKRVIPIVAGAAAVLLAPVATASAIAPFGHACTPQNGVRFCPTSSDPRRVKTFDGVPIDVDVTLPPTGKGPFPTIVILHGFPGSKASFESSSPLGDPSSTQTYHYNNVFFAQQGYAVVNYTARGFGRSCGDSSSRTKPSCNRGWFHFADQRWELHDTQFLLGKLVDEGVTNPSEIGATGTSYGGLQSMQLAFLKNRVRQRNGKLTAWTSPKGRALRIAAAWPRWGSSDFINSVAPNGRFLDYGGGWNASSVAPVGVAKRAVVDALYVGGVVLGYLAPQGADPTADLKTWHDEFFAGEPYGPKVKAVAKQFATFKSAVKLSGTPAPLLVMDGWTDPVFPATEALKPYNRLRAKSTKAPIVLQLADVGHFRAGNALGAYKRFNHDGAAFFAHYLKGKPGGPAAGSVTAFEQGCPKGVLGSGAISVPSFDKFARGSVRIGLSPSKLLTNGGGDSATGNFFNPVTNGDPCSQTDATAANGTEVLRRVSKGFTLAGLTRISAKVSNSGVFGQIDARLLDVSAGKERLVDTGVYRLTPGQTQKITFELFGNAYRFPKGHVVKLELLGRNAPSFLPDPSFNVLVSELHAVIPTREAPSAALGIAGPPIPH